jgi:hypothetical protein
MDPQAVDLINKLLAMNCFDRIGYDSFDELKAHPFFHGVDFEAIERREAMLPLMEDLVLKTDASDDSDFKVPSPRDKS